MNTTEYSPNQGILLIVDDIPANLSVLFDFLNESGFEVLVAQDGQRALKKAEYAQPELILMDVMMPNMDGFEACQALKANPKTKNIPVIFMTALNDTVDKVRGFEVGAEDYITKPIQHEEVLARVNAHLKLYRLQKQIENRNKELDAFTRTVAHDLKNPLNVMIGYVEEICYEYEEGRALDKYAMTSLHQAAQTGRKMVSIINALLTLARCSSANDVDMQPLDMDLLVKQVIFQRLTKLLTDYQGDIQLPKQWQAAKGYAPWIEEILANYLSNALKYGGRPPIVHLDSKINHDGMVCFQIIDNGPGLSPEAQKKLFTPFTRLHEARAEGHGLGLSIVQQVAEKMGGYVGVESEEGKGSIFYFCLPPVDK